MRNVYLKLRCGLLEIHQEKIKNIVNFVILALESILEQKKFIELKFFKNINSKNL